MSTNIKANCLSTKIVHSSPVFYNSLIDSQKTSGKVLIISETSPTEILKIVKLFKPSGIILNRSSLMGHVAGLLDSLSIQLAICKSLPKLSINSYIVINGQNDEITVFENKSEALLNLGRHQKSNTTKSSNLKQSSINIKVDAKYVEELKNAKGKNINGVGILRTEWIGYDQQKFPSEKTHYEYYKRAIKYAPGRLNIRLFDIGGDKLPKWAMHQKEKLHSPLGLRGIRAIGCLGEAFQNQVSAICKLSLDNQIGIVLPMVTDASEIVEFKDYLENFQSSKNLANIKLGAMVETPSSALTADEILEIADFIRIGPGDLSQFTLATLRDYIDPKYASTTNLHKSILKLIRMVAESGIKNKKEVNMCLDFEPRKILVEKLIDCGINTFCVSNTNIDALKSIIADLDK